VHAVARQLVGRHIVSDLPRLRGRRQQVSDQLVDLPLGSSDPLVPVEHRGESGVLVPAGVSGEEGVGLEHRLEPLTDVSGPVPDLGQVRKMRRDLPIVPGE
jgi:hypothetical protein